MSQGRVACIGSRTLGPSELELCRAIGRYLATKGYTISTGNARGADQAYGAGGNEIDPRLVELHLPWPGYEVGSILAGNRVIVDGGVEEYSKIAAGLHSRWNSLGRGPRALHTRNVGIVQGCSQVVAWPGPSTWGGGTGLGMKVGSHFGIRVVDLSKAEDRARVVSLLER